MVTTTPHTAQPEKKQSFYTNENVPPKEVRMYHPKKRKTHQRKCTAHRKGSQKHNVPIRQACGQNLVHLNGWNK